MSDKKVRVYYFKRWDQVSGQNVISTRRATLEAIKSCEGTPLLDTGVDVDELRLDGNGLYIEPT